MNDTADLNTINVTAEADISSEHALSVDEHGCIHIDSGPDKGKIIKCWVSMELYDPAAEQAYPHADGHSALDHDDAGSMGLYLELYGREAQEK